VLTIDSDLNHSNQYIVGLALVTLGNIASVEMSRDLFPEVETIISSSNPYIRRKAALCAMRICRKVPDLQEHFLDKAKILLNDRNHGVLLCGLTLVIGLCEADELEGGENGIVETFRPVAPAMVKVLKSLANSGYTPEHDVNGIADPFLQCKILRLLRVLSVGDADTSELINDILAQVATNTDGSKNVGNSILYEAVRVILDIEADSALKVLGVNILGKFLANKDNNIRYVALNTLVKVVAIEPNAVQRHRNTILDCLRDPDISIRRRALELSFTLINESNVKVLVRELLAFLEIADNEFKPNMTSQIGIAADRYAPNKRWHIDTMLRVMKLVSICPLHKVDVLLINPGWTICERADSLFFCQTHRNNSRVANLLCQEALCSTKRGHYARGSHPRCHMGDWRVCRCFTERDRHRCRRRHRSKCAGE
jgi:AP-1 complex subunit gamma-1